jgi:hypothetical protein
MTWDQWQLRLPIWKQQASHPENGRPYYLASLETSQPPLDEMVMAGEPSANAAVMAAGRRRKCRQIEPTFSKFAEEPTRALNALKALREADDAIREQNRQHLVFVWGRKTGAGGGTRYRGDCQARKTSKRPHEVGNT